MLFHCAGLLVALTPFATVKAGTNRVLHILRQHQGNKQKQKAEIRKVVDKYFDFRKISKEALGPYWNKLTSTRQQEYVKAF